jgi:hypothetical protein
LKLNLKHKTQNPRSVRAERPTAIQKNGFNRDKGDTGDRNQVNRDKRDKQDRSTPWILDPCSSQGQALDCFFLCTLYLALCTDFPHPFHPLHPC